MSARQVNALKREEMQRRRTRVADLRLLGLTQNKIAQELGVSEATITKDIRWWMEQLKAQGIQDAEQVRLRQLAEVGKMREECYAVLRDQRQIVKSPDGKSAVTYKKPEAALKAIVTLTQLLKRESELVGADAPQQIDVTSGGQPLPDNLYTLLELLNQSQLSAGDVFGAMIARLSVDRVVQ